MERVPPASEDPLQPDEGEAPTTSEPAGPPPVEPPPPVAPPAPERPPEPGAEPAAPPPVVEPPLPERPPIPPTAPEPKPDHDLELRDRRRYVLGIALVILGVLLLAGQYIDIWRWAWPLVLIGGGLLLIFRDRRP